MAQEQKRPAAGGTARRGAQVSSDPETTATIGLYCLWLKAGCWFDEDRRTPASSAPAFNGPSGLKASEPGGGWLAPAVAGHFEAYSAAGEARIRTASSQLGVTVPLEDHYEFIRGLNAAELGVLVLRNVD